jgi:HlyD family secretion protein
MENSATPPWETKKKTVKRGLLRKLLLWGFFIGLIGFVAYGLKPKPIPVETAEVTRGPLTVSVLEEGKTRIRNRYVVAAPVSGNMRRVALKAGDNVKANETVLTVIEPGLAPLLDARGQAQAEAVLAGTNAAKMQAEQSLEMARTSAQFAKLSWDRVKSNAIQGSISITDRESIEREALVREREVRAGEFKLQVAEFEVAQAKASLLQLTTPSGTGSLVEVKAPVSGRILKVEQESAMIVSAGTPLLEIGDPADLEIEAEILSRDAVAIRAGAEVQVEQWGGDTPLKARVRRIEPAAFTKVSALGVEEQRVIVLSDLDSPPESARVLGDRYRVEVRVAVWHEADVLLVPSGALFREGRDWKTFVLKANKAAKVLVQTGRTDGKSTQVMDGLNQGDLVLMHPPDVVKDGSEVVRRMVE